MGEAPRQTSRKVSGQGKDIIWGMILIRSDWSAIRFHCTVQFYLLRHFTANSFRPWSAIQPGTTTGAWAALLRGSAPEARLQNQSTEEFFQPYRWNFFQHIAGLAAVPSNKGRAPASLFASARCPDGE